MSFGGLKPYNVAQSLQKRVFSSHAALLRNNDFCHYGQKNLFQKSGIIFFSFIFWDFFALFGTIWLSMYS